MELLSLNQIKELIRGMDLLPEIEAGYRRS